MHLVGFIIRIYHNARSPEREITSNTPIILGAINLEKLFVSKRCVKAVVLVDASKHVQCEPITENN